MKFKPGDKIIIDPMSDFYNEETEKELGNQILTVLRYPNIYPVIDVMKANGSESKYWNENRFKLAVPELNEAKLKKALNL